MSRRRLELDENATFIGILLGLLVGAVYALLRIERRGAVRRKDLTQFRAATTELEIEASIREAKQLARARLEEGS